MKNEITFLRLNILEKALLLEDEILNLHPPHKKQNASNVA